MTCDEVQDRLVAWHDDELSPSEAVQVGEHVATCPRCARSSHRLADALPLPPPRAPTHVLRRLDRALDVDALLAEAERPIPRVVPRGSVASRAWRSFTVPASVPAGAVALYIGLLAATFVWGVSNWWTLSSLRGGHATPAAATAIHGIERGAIPADHFRPASYDPDPEAADRDADGIPDGREAPSDPPRAP